MYIYISEPIRNNRQSHTMHNSLDYPDYKQILMRLGGNIWNKIAANKLILHLFAMIVKHLQVYDANGTLY